MGANNLYRQTIIKKPPRNGFASGKVDALSPEKKDKLIKKEKKEHILEADKECPKELHKNRSELPFLVERMKIRKVEKLVPNLKDKYSCVVHIKSLNSGIKARF